MFVVEVLLVLADYTNGLCNHFIKGIFAKPVYKPQKFLLGNKKLIKYNMTK